MEVPPKNEGKRVHVPPDEKTCGHTVLNFKYILMPFMRQIPAIFVLGGI